MATETAEGKTAASKTLERRNGYYEIDGKFYPSVTTILGRVIAKPGLLHWYGKVGKEEAERLTGVINNVLDMTKLESGALEIHKELQLIEEVLGAALSRLEKRLGSRAVDTRVAPSLPMVPMDGRLIEQVFLNLFDNALKYTPPGSPIEVTVSRDDATIVIEVADRGPGLPGDDPERLFEKFYRRDQKGREGFGLGLTICRGIIEAHGGTITASNRSSGSGAVFRFSLPLETTLKPT